MSKSNNNEIKAPRVVAEMLNISLKTLKKIKKNKEITYVKIANRHGWGVLEDDIRKYIKAQLILRTDKTNKREV